MVQPLWKTVWRFLKKLKIDLLYDPAISLLGIYPKKTKTVIPKDTCTPVFTAALFIVARIWKQLKCPSIAAWIKKRYTHKHTHTHIYNGILLSHKNGKKEMAFLCPGLAQYLFLILIEIKLSIYHNNKIVVNSKNYQAQQLEQSMLPRTYSAFSDSTFLSAS